MQNLEEVLVEHAGIDTQAAAFVAEEVRHRVVMALQRLEDETDIAKEWNESLHEAIRTVENL